MIQYLVISWCTFLVLISHETSDKEMTQFVDIIFRRTTCLTKSLI
jgi:hypothetical protein